MGGKSTLHSAVLKDDTQSVSSSFDVRSWQGLTHVLKVAKGALTEPGAYTEFQNLVLQYAQQGGDVEIKKRIDAIIAGFEKNKPQEATQPSNGVMKEQTEEKVVETVAKAPLETVQIEGATALRGGRRTKPTFGALPQEEIAVPELSSESVVVPVVLTEVREPVPPLEVPEEVVQEEPPHEADSTPIEEVQVSEIPKTLEEYKARITEIKRIVHDRIGNPVSLMGNKDGNGKRYMSALLSALKATGAGGTGNAVSAMHDLEEAFSVLMDEVGHVDEEPQDKHDDSISVPVEPVQETVVVDVVPEVVVQEDVPIEPKDTSEEEPSIPVEPEVIPQEAPVPEQKIEVVVPPEPLPPLQEDVVETQVVDEQPSVPAETIQEEDVPVEVQDTPLGRSESFQSSFQKTDETISAVVGSVHKNKKQIDENPLASALVDEDDGYDKWEVDPKSEAQEKITKIIESESLVEKSTRERSTSDEDTEAHEQQAELSSPHITTALNKLLQEWSVFSGSGLFGMGPDGLEHPLYIELAPLSMGEVLAGRWENANSKTLRAIKEYVDAWRHEQSITYTINETFEHYLRRVVQRIQKRQTH